MSGCTSTESLAALGYLRRSFTCYDLDAQAERSLLRTFQKYPADAVMAALEEFKATSTHWPVPAQLEAVIAKRRGKRPKGTRTVRDYPRVDQDFGPDGPIVDIPESEFTPPAEISERVGAIRGGLR